MNRRELLGKVVAASSVAALPVVAAGNATYKIKMVTTWLKNFPGLGTGANELAATIEKLSGGQIKIKVYGANELVPAMQVFDAVQQGTAELGHAAPYYWQGKIPSAPFFSSIPFGFTATEMNSWLEFGGGQQLWDQAYEPFGVKPLTAGNSGTQMGGWFNKPINTVADLAKLKIRMPGLGAQVLTQLGATVVTLSGGEVFQALKSGTIDGAEWVGPYNDLAAGLHQAAKFYYWPGWHEPCSNIELLINKKFYQSLSKELQLVIEVACKAATCRMQNEYMARNGSALKTILADGKVKVMAFPEPVLKELQKVSASVVSAIADKDKMAQMVFTSMGKFRGDVWPWQKIAEIGYTAARGF